MIRRRYLSLVTSTPTLKDLPDFFRATGGDAGKQLDETFEGGFIARVGDEFQICRCVLNMRLLKKPDAAGDGERDLALGQFELQLKRVKRSTPEQEPQPAEPSKETANVPFG